jgi:hypothetical protein
VRPAGGSGGLGARYAELLLGNDYLTPHGACHFTNEAPTGVSPRKLQSTAVSRAAPAFARDVDGVRQVRETPDSHPTAGCRDGSGRPHRRWAASPGWRPFPCQTVRARRPCICGSARIGARSEDGSGGTCLATTAYTLLNELEIGRKLKHRRSVLLDPPDQAREVRSMVKMIIGIIAGAVAVYVWQDKIQR